MAKARSKRTGTKVESTEVETESDAPALVEDKTSEETDEAAPAADGSEPVSEEVDASSDETAASDANKGADPLPSEEPSEEVLPAPATTAVPNEPRRGGFFPLVLGGVVAAGLGFGAATYVLPEFLSPAAPPEEIASLTGQLTAIDGRIATLSQEINAIKSAPDTNAEARAELADKMAAELDSLRQVIGSLEERLNEGSVALDALSERLTTLEKRPVADGSASASALEAFGREMEEMRAEITAQKQDAEVVQQEIAATADAATSRIAAAEAEAQRLREEADAVAMQATARAALNRLQAALDTGAALNGALADLKAAGFEIPAPLAEQAQGVTTLAALRSAFPSAARDALSVSLKDTTSENTWDRIGAFLRSQSGARSLTPRAGDDPDAVLSRAEAALTAGDLQVAVTEIGKLPENGRDRMAEWVSLTERRIAALKAVNDLANELK